jgi:hypothetical protein
MTVLQKVICGYNNYNNTNIIDTTTTHIEVLSRYIDFIICGIDYFNNNNITTVYNCYEQLIIIIITLLDSKIMNYSIRYVTTLCYVVIFIINLNKFFLIFLFSFITTTDYIVQYNN